MRRALKLLLLMGIGFALARPGGGDPDSTTPGGGDTGGQQRPPEQFRNLNVSAEGTESASQTVQNQAEQGRGGEGDNNTSPGNQTPSTEPSYPDQWASPENLTEHYNNHKNDPDADWQSEAEYREGAIDLMSTDGGRRDGVRIKTDGDTSYFFDPATGEFGRSGPRGIITYYVPHPNPEAHFNRQPGTEV